MEINTTKPSDEAMAYDWGTCGTKVKFCMAVLDEFMTTNDKKRINIRIAKWYNKHGYNIVDDKGDLY